MKYIGRYFKHYKLKSICAPLFKLFEVLLELLVPLVIADIIDKGIIKGDKSYIYERAGLLALMSLVGFGFAAVAQFFAAYASAGIASDMRHDIFAKIQSLAVKDYEKLGASRLITITTSDINQIQSGINLTLRLLLRSPCVVIGAIIMAMTIDMKVSLIFIAAVIVLSIFVAFNLSRALPSYTKTRQGLDSLVTAADNGIAGVKIIRGFNRTADDYDAFVKKSQQLNKLQLAAAGISAFLNPVTFFIINLATCLMIYAGYIRVENGYLTAGAVVALYNYMAQILVELIKFADMAVSLSRAISCADRFGAVMDLPSEVRDVSSAIDAPHMAHSIEFDSVHFAYEGSSEACLQDISFSVRAGGCIGIIGRTGSGKSTIAKLLAGVYRPDSGVIRIDGKDISTLSKDDMNRSIGFALQKTELFSGSIADNIRIFRKDMTEEDLDKAVFTSCSDDIISGKKEGKAYKISVGGIGLSGGQKQRIGIARALAGRPGILILDDSTSALDAGTESRLLTRLDELQDKPTRLIISQKIRTVKDADIILLIEDGHISHAAPHEELLKLSESYRFLYKLQKEADNG